MNVRVVAQLVGDEHIGIVAEVVQGLHQPVGDNGGPAEQVVAAQ